MKKPIYSEPFANRLKDLQHTCEVILNTLELEQTRPATPADLRREGLREGEFAIGDWVVRPRFTESEQGCCGGKTYPITFQDWWKSLPRTHPSEDIRIVGNFEIFQEVAKAVWKSLGMSVED